MKLDEAIQLNESLGRLKDVAKVTTNMPDADFWIVRRGSEKTVGSVVEEYNSEHIGIKVTSSEVVPRFMYYAMMHLHNQGVWKRMATGTTNLVNIEVQDVRNISLQEMGR